MSNFVPPYYKQTLELKAIETGFEPIPLDAPDPLPDPELRRRVAEALAATHEDSWNLKNSSNYRNWSKELHRTALKQVRRDVINAWNNQQAAKSNTDSDHHG